MARKDSGWGFPVPCVVSDVLSTRPKQPCRHYIDITIKQKTQIKFIAFRNYCVANILVKMKTYRDVEQGLLGYHWVTLVSNHQLMADPHCEEDAQALHVVALPCDPGQLIAKLRIYLMQPSPVWRQVTLQLHHITCYAAGDPVSIRHRLIQTCQTNSPTNTPGTSANSHRRMSASEAPAPPEVPATVQPSPRSLLGPNADTLLTRAKDLKHLLGVCWDHQQAIGTSHTGEKSNFEPAHEQDDTVFVIGA